MSVWQCTPSAAPIGGSEGELVAVSITVNPRDLEALLEALASVDFPINPQICHAESETMVEFPPMPAVFRKWPRRWPPRASTRERSRSGNARGHSVASGPLIP